MVVESFRSFLWLIIKTILLTVQITRVVDAEYRMARTEWRKWLVSKNWLLFTYHQRIRIRFGYGSVWINNLIELYLPTFSESKAWDFYLAASEFPKMTRLVPKISENFRGRPEEFRSSEVSWCVWDRLDKTDTLGFFLKNLRTWDKKRNLHGLFFSQIGLGWHFSVVSGTC